MAGGVTGSAKHPVPGGQPGSGTDEERAESMGTTGAGGPPERRTGHRSDWRARQSWPEPDSEGHNR